VSGAINWLASKHQESKSVYFIVSFHLGNESYQKIFLPDCELLDVSLTNLGALRGCLCIVLGHDVWTIKEYRNKES